MAISSQEEQEKPAKVYQVEKLSDKVDNIVKLLEGQNEMLKTTITLPYLEERLKGIKRDIDSEMKLMKQEYRPTLKTTRWAARTGIGAAISVGLMIIGIYLKS